MPAVDRSQFSLLSSWYQLAQQPFGTHLYEHEFMQTQPPAVRFQDTAILPLSSPVDHPKVIESEVDCNQHPKSPPVTGPDGVATLLHRLGQPGFLERLLDSEGTATFDFRMKPNSDKESDFYIRRNGNEVEIGLVAADSRDETKPTLGVRYDIGPRSRSLPYRTGPWHPQSSSSIGSAWGGTATVARQRGSDLARNLWQNFHLQNKKVGTSGRAVVCIDWADMDASDRTKYDAWMAEFLEGVEKGNQESKIEYEKLKAEIGVDAILAGGFEDYKKTFLRCRAECGVEVATMRCSKCHFASQCILFHTSD
ncbi:hypothetical protein DFH07DRAFT_839370 [Mycena maculata]|uniref:Uncharacterized protein n=1 Tax=Mycena maculata TaxID=230809 RepID=A0AAD7N1J9_9AGAR|nr:hypothetical protein DFH07DRAFT_839370 [Mycena maculata]